MINNRQGNRRRGRGGPRPPGLSGNSGGNRQDNRSRGNAAQLLEKYKSLARDSQLAGDRVQTEYYLQFADHYFRVLGESRSRFEEQRRARGEDVDDEEYDDEGADGENEDGTEPQQRQDRGERQDRRRDRGDRPERYERGDRPERQDRPERAESTDGDGERRERFPRENRAERPERSRVNGRNRAVARDVDDAPAQIAFDTLPPAIGIVGEPASEPVADAAQDEAPRPRRRTRRPRSEEGGEEIAPAA